MKVSEIKAMSNRDIIGNIFYMGVAVANQTKKVKKEELFILRLCKELETRNIVEDAYDLYNSLCQ